ncbi:MAG: xylan 1,4-beta-xylosidase, partial [Prolixibacteraceae bacterium]|nr:xylan 1,4-beta-xylosidase [Prolixibacteraceae bacterium]
DNETYTKFGSTLNMKFDLSVFCGNKFSIFNYATHETGGYVDIDWFSTEEIFSEGMFYDDSFEGFTEEQVTLDSLYVSDGIVEMLVGTSKTLKITALFKDSHTENVTSSAKITNPDPDIVSIANGQLVAKKDGNVTITATYKGKMGESETIEFEIVCMTFPLTDELFNPSIFADGSFNEETGELVTGQYGFGGWIYENGIDLSDYKYLIVELGNNNTNGASFRIFDQSSYWSDPFMHDVGSRRQLVIDLHHMGKTVNGTKRTINPSNIYIAGFWSFGGSPIVIDDVYVTADEGFSPTHPLSYVSSELIKNDDNPFVNVYTLMGKRIKTNVLKSEATLGLPPGFYIVGRQKVVVNY